MKIFFTCSTTGRAKYFENFKKVHDTIKAYGIDEIYTPEGHNERNLWLTDGEKFLSVLNLKRKKKLQNLNDIPENPKHPHHIYHEAIRNCIKIADAVIIDGTYPSFRLGNEATIALQQKKPTLILSIYKDYSSFIDSPYLYGAKYTKYNLKEIIFDFLDKAQKLMLKNRFNLMISDSHKAKLEKLAVKNGISQAEVLRDLLEQAESRDSEF